LPHPPTAAFTFAAPGHPHGARFVPDRGVASDASRYVAACRCRLLVHLAAALPLFFTPSICASARFWLCRSMLWRLKAFCTFAVAARFHQAVDHRIRHTGYVFDHKLSPPILSQDERCCAHFAGASGEAWRFSAAARWSHTFGTEILLRSANTPHH
jgi:hypothetical protein